jgi:hypothetical protein
MMVMADNLGARKCGKQKVICKSPTKNKTPVGNAQPPIPYPVMVALDASAGCSTNVNYNGKPAFTMKSDTTKVTGDAPGVLKGTSSSTVSDIANAKDKSKTVLVNGNKTIRCDDVYFMNKKNTKGTLVCSPAPSAPPITDDGKI